MFITLQTKQASRASSFREEKSGLFFPQASVYSAATVNRANDKLEQEAEATADEMMSDESRVQRAGTFFKPVASAVNSSINRKCKQCEQEQHELQRKEETVAGSSPDNQLEGYVNTLDNTGKKLPHEVRSFYEPRFGYDFGDVRIHTDTEASESAQSINALAYTTGNNIVFNHEQYSPGSTSGKRLLAHELTHVVQQNNNQKTISRTPDKSGTQTGRYSFSNNCGWIDWGHADKAFAIKLIKQVQQASDALENSEDKSIKSTGAFSSPEMTSGIPHTPIILSGAKFKVRLLRPLSSPEVVSVALNIFKKLSVAFEAQQEWTDLIGDSSFAQEDLPSNLISFYAAAKGYTKEDVKKFCADVGPVESIAKYKSNDKFVKNRTFTPVGATGDWPGELSTIDDSQASSLYEIDTINTRQGTESFTFCPIYRIEGRVNETDLIIVSAGGVSFTAADNVKVVPTYRVESATSGTYGHTKMVAVEPYSQADYAAFSRNKINIPLMVPRNVLVCLSSKGNKV